MLLDKLHDQPQRDWYAGAAAEHGWSRNVLLNQIMNRLHERTGAAPSNFTAQLPAKDSELAQQLTRDPYVLDFLELTGPAAERDLEASSGCRPSCSSSATGSRSLAGSTTSPSMAMTSTSTCCSSTGRSPASSLSNSRSAGSHRGHAGQLGFYVAWVDANLRVTDRHAPTIGILLCAGRNDSVVRYCLAGSTAPLAVADFTYDALPPAARAAIPTETELTDAADAALDQFIANAELPVGDNDEGNVHP